jgi:hypothetical protein
MATATPPPIRLPVITWYKVYCAFMALLYLFVVVMGLVFLVLGLTQTRVGKSDFEMVLLGVLYGGLGFVFLVPYVVALFLRPRPWVWIFGMVLICIGMNSCCLLPACIPLLIFWIKPETKTYFGRK